MVAMVMRVDQPLQTLQGGGVPAGAEIDDRAGVRACKDGRITGSNIRHADPERHRTSVSRLPSGLWVRRS